MVFPHLKEKEFFTYIEVQGCKLISDRSEAEDVLVYSHNNKIVPVQIERVYYPYLVCKLCKDLDIPVPESMQKVLDSIEEMRRIQNRNKS